MAAFAKRSTKERAKPYEEINLVWPEHGLDWTDTFPMLVKDGSGGYEAFEMPTAHMMRRSKPISRALGYYKPEAQDRVQGIGAPDRGVITFKYYENVVKTNEATLDQDRLAVEPSAAPRDKDRAANENGDDDTARANAITTSYCQGHFLAEELGDHPTAHLILEALIEHFIKTNTHFTVHHIRMMADFRARSDEGQISSRLWYLGLNLWVFAPAWQIEKSPGPLPPTFSQSLYRQEMAYLRHGVVVNKVEKVEDCPFLQGPPWRYVPPGSRSKS